MIGPVTAETYIFRLQQYVQLLTDQRDWAIQALARMHRCTECEPCQCANDWPDPTR